MSTSFRDMQLSSQLDLPLKFNVFVSSFSFCNQTKRINQTFIDRLSYQFDCYTCQCTHDCLQDIYMSVEFYNSSLIFFSFVFVFFCFFFCSRSHNEIHLIRKISRKNYRKLCNRINYSVLNWEGGTEKFMPKNFLFSRAIFSMLLFSEIFVLF